MALCTARAPKSGITATYDPPAPRRRGRVSDETVTCFRQAAFAMDLLGGYLRGWRRQHYTTAGMPYGESVEAFERWCADQD